VPVRVLLPTASPHGSDIGLTGRGDNGFVTTDRIRVLFQPSFFLAERWNGIDEHLLLLAKYLDPSRFDLLLTTSAADGPQSRLLSARANLRSIPVPEVSATSARTRIAAFRSLYAREGVDILHLHSPVAGGHAAPALAARLAGVPATLVTYHQIQPWRLPMRSRLINCLTHALLIDGSTAVSADVRDTLVQRTGLPRRGLRVVHNGIETAHDIDVPPHLPHLAEGDVRIGYFGRLSPEKGVDDLLAALALLAPSAPHVRTLIVGDGPERERLVAMTASLGITDRVTFLGFRPEARRIMEEVDIVVHAPVYEGFGLVVLEAMAAGRPVVVNDAPGGLREIVVPGTTGLMVPSNQPDALARALATLAADPCERQRLGRNGRLRCERRFSAQVMAERVAACYEALIGRRQHGLSARLTRRRSAPAADQPIGGASG
jgi:glycosyltransferase involved in cell wall biosynthesis